jgi:hypothetical protein
MCPRERVLLRNKSKIVIVLSVLAFFTLLSAGKQEDQEYPQGTIEITGRIRLVGTALFSNMVITDSQDRDWYVENEDRQKLSSLEQREVTVRGKTEYRDIIMASGEKAGVRRYLRDIKIMRSPLRKKPD